MFFLNSNHRETFLLKENSNKESEIYAVRISNGNIDNDCIS